MKVELIEETRPYTFFNYMLDPEIIIAMESACFLKKSNISSGGSVLVFLHNEEGYAYDSYYIDPRHLKEINENKN